MIRFSKYHGCGNNFIMIKEAELLESRRGAKGTDSEERGAKGADPEERGAKGTDPEENAYPELAKKVCDINTGIGADGLIIVREEPELEMVFYNMDGSRAPMCGNGIRCFAYFCMKEGICSEKKYRVKTLAGDMVVEVTSVEPFRARIDMGKPIFEPQAIAVKTERSDFLKQELTIDDGSKWTVNSLFIGTVHTVVFVEDYESFDVEYVGRQLCEHPVYTEKTNVNFVKVIDEETIEIKTYERGVGMTLACGTGACASVVTAVMQGLCKCYTEVILKLGRLAIDYKDDGSVFMEGPSVKIAEGTLERG